MAISFQCPECGTNWPYYRTFDICPECGVACRSAATPRVLTSGEAKTRLLRIEFERYYAARETFRTGPTPEEIGRAEARAEIEARTIEQNDDDPGD